MNEEDFYFTGRDGSGLRIKEFTCTNDDCGYKTSKAEWGDRDEKNTEPVSVTVTGGFYGPNGNGYNYWCRKCEYRVSFETDYSAMKQLLG